MPKMYNPETQETIDVHGSDVQLNLHAGYVVVGNRPESEYVGKTREEIHGDESETDRQERVRSEPARTIAEVQQDESGETRRAADQRGPSRGPDSADGSRSNR